MKDNIAQAINKLTILYVAVLGVVCVLFSVFIYNLASLEIDQSSRRQAVGIRTMLGGFIIDEERTEALWQREVSEARARLKAKLLLANILVVGAGAILCYELARRTLRPIEEAAIAQERFTSDASHELRTPLAIMRSEIEVALRDPALTLADSKHLLESNLEEVNTMHKLTENLLYLARHKQLGERKVTDLAKLSQSVVKKFAKRAASQNVTLHSTVQPLELAVHREALTQTLSILIDNAIKYAGSGSTIEISTRPQKHKITIAVRDDGVGIPQEIAPYVFDRFTRGDVSRTSQGSNEGQGLGLSIAKQLVESMSGSIHFKSTPGKGAVFYIDLPRAVQSKQ